MKKSQSTELSVPSSSCEKNISDLCKTFREKFNQYPPSSSLMRKKTQLYPDFFDNSKTDSSSRVDFLLTQNQKKINKTRFNNKKFFWVNKTTLNKITGLFFGRIRTTTIKPVLSAKLDSESKEVLSQENTIQPLQKSGSFSDFAQRSPYELKTIQRNQLKKKLLLGAQHKKKLPDFFKNHPIFEENFYPLLILNKLRRSFLTPKKSTHHNRKKLSLLKDGLVFLSHIFLPPLPSTSSPFSPVGGGGPGKRGKAEQRKKTSGTRLPRYFFFKEKETLSKKTNSFRELIEAQTVFSSVIRNLKTKTGVRSAFEILEATKTYSSEVSNGQTILEKKFGFLDSFSFASKKREPIKFFQDAQFNESHLEPLIYPRSPLVKITKTEQEHYFNKKSSEVNSRLENLLLPEQSTFLQNKEVFEKLLPPTLLSKDKNKDKDKDKDKVVFENTEILLSAKKKDQSFLTQLKLRGEIPIIVLKNRTRNLLRRLFRTPYVVLEKKKPTSLQIPSLLKEKKFFKQKISGSSEIHTQKGNLLFFLNASKKFIRDTTILSDSENSNFFLPKESHEKTFFRMPYRKPFFSYWLLPFMGLMTLIPDSKLREEALHTNFKINCFLNNGSKEVLSQNPTLGPKCLKLPLSLLTPKKAKTLLWVSNPPILITPVGSTLTPFFVKTESENAMNGEKSHRMIRKNSFVPFPKLFLAKLKKRRELRPPFPCAAKKGEVEREKSYRDQPIRKLKSSTKKTNFSEDNSFFPKKIAPLVDSNLSFSKPKNCESFSYKKTRPPLSVFSKEQSFYLKAVLPTLSHTKAEILLENGVKNQISFSYLNKKATHQKNNARFFNLKTPPFFKKGYAITSTSFNFLGGGRRVKVGSQLLLKKLNASIKNPKIHLSFLTAETNPLKLVSEKKKNQVTSIDENFTLISQISSSSSSPYFAAQGQDAVVLIKKTKHSLYLQSLLKELVIFRNLISLSMEIPNLEFPFCLKEESQGIVLTAEEEKIYALLRKPSKNPPILSSLNTDTKIAEYGKHFLRKNQSRLQKIPSLQKLCDQIFIFSCLKKSYPKKLKRGVLDFNNKNLRKEKLVFRRPSLKYKTILSNPVFGELSSSIDDVLSENKKGKKKLLEGCYISWLQNEFSFISLATQKEEEENVLSKNKFSRAQQKKKIKAVSSGNFKKPGKERNEGILIEDIPLTKEHFSVFGFFKKNDLKKKNATYNSFYEADPNYENEELSKNLVKNGLLFLQKKDSPKIKARTYNKDRFFFRFFEKRRQIFLQNRREFFSEQEEILKMRKPLLISGFNNNLLGNQVSLVKKNSVLNSVHLFPFGKEVPNYFSYPFLNFNKSTKKSTPQWNNFSYWFQAPNTIKEGLPFLLRKTLTSLEKPQKEVQKEVQKDVQKEGQKGIQSFSLRIRGEKFRIEKLPGSIPVFSFLQNKIIALQAKKVESILLPKTVKKSSASVVYNRKLNFDKEELNLTFIKKVTDSSPHSPKKNKKKVFLPFILGNVKQSSNTILVPKKTSRYFNGNTYSLRRSLKFKKEVKKSPRMDKLFRSFLSQPLSFSDSSFKEKQAFVVRNNSHFLSKSSQIFLSRSSSCAASKEFSPFLLKHPRKFKNLKLGLKYSQSFSKKKENKHVPLLATQGTLPGESYKVKLQNKNNKKGSNLLVNNRFNYSKKEVVSLENKTTNFLGETNQESQKDSNYIKDAIKNLKKKRRALKQRRETGRLLKRKRFTPRPAWGRLTMYQKFLKHRHKKEKVFSQKKSVTIFLENQFAFVKKPAFINANFLRSSSSLVEKEKDPLLETKNFFPLSTSPFSHQGWKGKGGRLILTGFSQFTKRGKDPRVPNTSSFEPNYIPSLVSLEGKTPTSLLGKKVGAGRKIFLFPPIAEKAYYNISQTVFAEFQEGLWKSSWLRTNLNSYLQKIKNSFLLIKKTSQKSAESQYFNLTLARKTNDNLTLQKKWNNVLKIAEYNQITYNRIQQIISNITHSASDSSLRKKTSFFSVRRAPITLSSKLSNSLSAPPPPLLRKEKGGEHSCPPTSKKAPKKIKRGVPIREEAFSGTEKKEKRNRPFNNARHKFKKTISKDLTLFSFANTVIQTPRVLKSTFHKTLTENPFFTIQAFENMSKKRVYWALNKTNMWNFKNSNRKEYLWANQKQREQNRSNKTKKIIKKILTLINEPLQELPIRGNSLPSILQNKEPIKKNAFPFEGKDNFEKTTLSPSFLNQNHLTERVSQKETTGSLEEFVFAPKNLLSDSFKTESLSNYNLEKGRVVRSTFDSEVSKSSLFGSEELDQSNMKKWQKSLNIFLKKQKQKENKMGDLGFFESNGFFRFKERLPLLTNSNLSFFSFFSVPLSNKNFSTNSLKRLYKEAFIRPKNSQLKEHRLFLRNLKNTLRVSKKSGSYSSLKKNQFLNHFSYVNLSQLGKKSEGNAFAKSKSYVKHNFLTVPLLGARNSHFFNLIQTKQKTHFFRKELNITREQFLDFPENKATRPLSTFSLLPLPPSSTGGFFGREKVESKEGGSGRGSKQNGLLLKQSTFFIQENAAKKNKNKNKNAQVSLLLKKSFPSKVFLVCTILFHLCSLFSLVSISQIRDVIKFLVLFGLKLSAFAKVGGLVPLIRKNLEFKTKDSPQLRKVNDPLSTYNLSKSFIALAQHGKDVKFSITGNENKINKNLKIKRAALLYFKSMNVNGHFFDKDRLPHYELSTLQTPKNFKTKISFPSLEQQAGGGFNYPEEKAKDEEIVFSADSVALKLYKIGASFRLWKKKPLFLERTLFAKAVTRTVLLSEKRSSYKNSKLYPISSNSDNLFWKTDLLLPFSPKGGSSKKGDWVSPTRRRGYSSSPPPKKIIRGGKKTKFSLHQKKEKMGLKNIAKRELLEKINYFKFALIPKLVFFINRLIFFKNASLKPFHKKALRKVNDPSELEFKNQTRNQKKNVEETITSNNASELRKAPFFLKFLEGVRRSAFLTKRLGIVGRSSVPFVFEEKSPDISIKSSSNNFITGIQKPKRKGKQINFINLRITKTKKYFLKTFLKYGLKQVGSIFHNGVSKFTEVRNTGIQSIAIFLGKPGESSSVWINNLFLIEIASDLTTTIPENSDSAIWNIFTKLAKSSSLRITPVLGTLLEKRLFSSFELFIERLSQPDTDLIVRQQKGKIFWDIWGEVLKNVAEENNINIALLANKKEDQSFLLSKLLDNNQQQSKPTFGLFRLATSSEESSISNISTGYSTRRELLPSPPTCYAREGGVQLFPLSFVKREKVFLDPIRRRPSYLGWEKSQKNIKRKEKVPHTSTTSPSFLGGGLDGFNTNWKRWSANQYMTFKGKDSDLLIQAPPAPKSFHSLYPSGSVAREGYTSIKKNSQLGMGNNYTFNGSSLIKGIAPLGTIICQIYSGLFSKETAKNFLVVGTTLNQTLLKTGPCRAPFLKELSSSSSSYKNSNSDEKSLLIQSLAGETEMKIIRDNANRYNFSLGIKSLRNVFDALALHTPCIFLIEDIHVIGERRPLLEGDDENAAESAASGGHSSSSGGGGESHDEKNFSMAKLTRHSVMHYRKPFRGDFSFLIPANNYSFDLFLGAPTYEIMGSGRAKQTGSAAYGRTAPLNPIPFEPSLSHSAKNPKENYLIRTSNLQSRKSQQLSKRNFSLKTQDIVKELPWIGLAEQTSSQISMKGVRSSSGKKKASHAEVSSSSSPVGGKTSFPKIKYSIRVKIALLASLAVSNLSVKLNMITDLLVIIDSVRSNRGFVVFATTHTPSILDPALRRPGRLDETIALPFIPKLESRWEIIKSNVASLNSGSSISSSKNPAPSFFYTGILSTTFSPIKTRFGSFLAPLLKMTEKSDSGFPIGLTVDLLDYGLFNFPLSKSFSFFVRRRKRAFFQPLKIQENLTTFKEKKKLRTNVFLNQNKKPLTLSKKKKKTFTFFLEEKSPDNPIKSSSNNFLTGIQKKKGKSTTNVFLKEFMHSSSPYGGSKTRKKALKGLPLSLVSSLNLSNKKDQISRNSPSYMVLRTAYSKIGQFLINNKFVSCADANLSLFSTLHTNLENQTSSTGNNLSSSSTSSSSSSDSFGEEEFLLRKIPASPYLHLYTKQHNIKQYLIGLFAPKVSETLAFSSNKKQRSPALNSSIDSFNKDKSPNNKEPNIKIKTELSVPRKRTPGNNQVLTDPITTNQHLIPSFGYSSLQGIDKTWRAASSLIFTLIEKRLIYKKTVIIPKLLQFYNAAVQKSSLQDAPSPPVSFILLPAKRYENYKRSFLAMQFGISTSFSSSKILKEPTELGLGNSNLFLALLSNVPVNLGGDFSLQTKAKSKKVRKRIGKGATIKRKQAFNLVSLIKAKNVLQGKDFFPFGLRSKGEEFFDKPTVFNGYYRNRILDRHRGYLNNQWWNGQLYEHNVETTFLSDIDWRSNFVSALSSKKEKQTILQRPSLNLKSSRFFVKSESKESTESKESKELHTIKTKGFFRFRNTQEESLLSGNTERTDSFRSGLMTTSLKEEDQKKTPNSSKTPMSISKVSGLPTKNQEKEDFFIDFPDFDQHYNPGNRRWVLHFGYWSYWYNFKTTHNNEIQAYMVTEAFLTTFNFLNSNREILDYFVTKIIKSGLIKEIAIVDGLKRF